jgi:pyridoxal phosphate enzyme, YggS family
MQSRMQIFDDNFKIIKENIMSAAEKSGRKAEDITLLAATKTVPVEVINHAIAAGLRVIGENRVQEFLSKYDELDKQNCEMQLIGKLQTNKVKYIIDKVSMIQSVDSVKLAKEISTQALKRDLTMDILLEVNIGREESKSGVMPEQIYEILDEIRLFPAISVKGLMAIPPICDDNTQLSAYFSSMRQYYVDILEKKLDNISMQQLSMGMSDDYVQAIENGATTVRIGSALFGRRSY